MTDTTGDVAHHTLRAVAHAPGPPEVLRLEDAVLPPPAAGQVLLAVEAAGVAFGDAQARQGRLPARFPYHPGYDAVGRITALGPAVGGVEVGQRVAAFTGTGANATAVLAAAQRCVPVPADLDPARVAALVLNYTTAWQMLHRAAAVPSGGSVLVLGAAGGVGSALSELALADGLRVYGTASPARRAALAERGVIALADRDDLPERVDVVFDPIGGPSLAASRQAARRSGTVVSYGVSHASSAGLSRSRAMAVHLSALARAKLTPGARVAVFTILASTTKDPAAFRQDLAHLLDLLQAGAIDPQVTTMALAEVAQAHRRLEDRQVAGKLVLRP